MVEWVRASSLFSVVFLQEPTRILCFIVFWDGKARRQICVLSEPIVPEVAAAEIACLSRFFAVWIPRVVLLRLVVVPLS